MQESTLLQRGALAHRNIGLAYPGTRLQIFYALNLFSFTSGLGIISLELNYGKFLLSNLHAVYLMINILV